MALQMASLTYLYLNFIELQIIEACKCLFANLFKPETIQGCIFG